MYNRFEDPEYIDWAKQVKARDNYVCQICGREGGWLNSHHLNSYNMFIQQRLDIDNGITLCVNCHDLYHLIYKKGCNTKVQFEEYRTILELIEKIAKENAKR